MTSQKNLSYYKKCMLPLYKQTGLKTDKTAKNQSIEFRIQSIDFFEK